MRMKLKEICKLPNLLSLLRLVLVPVTMVLICRARLIAAFITFVIAELTDLVDGFIARKFGLITELGKFLDPMADKLMSIGVIFSFTLCGILPIFVVIVLGAKELLMLLGGIRMIRRGKIIPSNKLGKLCAFAMNVAIATGFFCQYPMWEKIYYYVIYIGLAFSVLAMVQYGIKNYGVIFGSAGAEIESSK